MDNEENALRKAEKFYNTPVVKYLDSLGQVFLVNDNGLTSYYQYDVQGRLVKSIDPRLYDSNLRKETAYYNFKYDYGIRGKSGENDSETPLKIDSADAGVSFSLENALGNLFWYHSPRHFEQLIIYDELQRKLEVRSKKLDRETAEEKEILAETYQYGESQANATEHNLRGQLFQLRDQSGIVTNNDYSIQGELLTTTRRLTETYEGVINWDEPEAVRLESETYTSQFSFNAHQQLIRETTPDGSITENQYNCLGLLAGVKVTFKDRREQPIINHIDYNAKGQRQAVNYGNGVTTKYSYEDTTWRLIKLYSIRPDRKILQDIDYTYDPVGNITRLRDNSCPTVFYNNQKVDPLSDYTYDAHYRLVKANGRQHHVLNSQKYQNNQQEDDFKRSKSINPNNGQGLENYQETYHYDRAGNLIKTTHTASYCWTRTQDILPNCDRLKSVIPGSGMINTENIPYDESGNQLQLNGNSTVKLTWNGWEQLAKAVIIKRPGKDDCDYYTYDSVGMRTRKVCKRWLNGSSVKETETKVYLGNYEIKRLQRQGETGNVTQWQRPTLRVMDDETCVAIFQVVEENSRKEEVKTSETTKLRYQLDNHLGSVALEVDKEAQIISYEEYFPYGGTALIAGRNQQEVKQKEYRYCGKERDDSTGLYYYGARYYAPWLGRWLSCDPAGTVDGLNLFEFVGGNPVKYQDAKGCTIDQMENRYGILIQGGTTNTNGRRRQVIGTENNLLTPGQVKGFEVQQEIRGIRNQYPNDVPWNELNQTNNELHQFIENIQNDDVQERNRLIGAAMQGHGLVATAQNPGNVLLGSRRSEEYRNLANNNDFRTANILDWDIDRNDAFMAGALLGNNTFSVPNKNPRAYYINKKKPNKKKPQGPGRVTIREIHQVRKFGSPCPVPIAHTNGYFVIGFSNPDNAINQHDLAKTGNVAQKNPLPIYLTLPNIEKENAPRNNLPIRGNRGGGRGGNRGGGRRRAFRPRNRGRGRP